MDKKIENKIDIYREMLQINTDVILSRDLSKIAKDHNIRKKTLRKMLKKRGYVYDFKSKGYICTKSVTESLKLASTALEDNINNLIRLQFEFNNAILEKSHLIDSMQHCAQKSDKEEIIDVEVNLVPKNEWSYTKKSVKIDEKVWEEYIRVCESKYKGLKRQEITTIVLDKFIRENS